MNRKDLLKTMAVSAASAVAIGGIPRKAHATTNVGGAIVCNPLATDHTREIQSALTLAMQQTEAEVWIPARADGRPWVITRVQALGTGVQRLYIRAWGQIRSSIANSYSPKHIFLIANLERIVAEGLDVYYTGPVNTGGSYTGTHDCIYVTDCKSVKLDQCRAQRGTYAGIRIRRSRNVDVSNCEGHYNRCAGLAIFDGAEFVTVNGGKYSFNGLDSDLGTGYGVACFQQPIGSEAQEVIMQGIVSHDNYRKGLDAHAGRRLIFAHNEMYRNKLYGLFATAQNAGSGFLLGEALIEGNIVAENTYRESAYTTPKLGIQVGAQGVSTCRHLSVVHNYIENVSDYGIHANTSGARTVRIDGNTVDKVDGTPGRAISTDAAGKPMSLQVNGNIALRARSGMLFERADVAHILNNTLNNSEIGGGGAVTAGSGIAHKSTGGNWVNGSLVTV
jgi:hypothetical protein